MSNVIINPYRFEPVGVLDPPAIHGANLLWWYRADLDVTTTTGDEVTSWVDQVTGITSTPPDATTRPTLVSSAINGFPAIDFTTDGTGCRLDAPSSAPVENIWTKSVQTDVWMIFTITNAGDHGRMAAKGRPITGSATGWWYRLNGEPPVTRFRFGAAGTGNNMDTTIQNGWTNGAFAMRVRWDGTMNVKPTVEVNDVLQAFDPGGFGSGSYVSDVGQTWTIGNEAIGGNDFPGQIAEFYAAIDPTATTLTQDKAYISDRYAVL